MSTKKNVGKKIEFFLGFTAMILWFLCSGQHDVLSIETLQICRYHIYTFFELHNTIIDFFFWIPISP
jgi:hypothetical protein